MGTISATAAADPRRILDAALASAASAGATESFAVLTRHRSAATRFSDNAITQNLTRRQAALRVEATIGRRRGTAATNRLDAEGIRAATSRAVDLARAAPEDPEYVPPLGPQVYPAVDGYRSSTASLSPREAAARLLPVFDAARARGVRMAGSLQMEEGDVQAANSSGLRAGHRWTSAAYANTAIADDLPASGHGASGWAECVDPDVEALDLVGAADAAIAKAEAARAPRALAPGSYPVVLEAPALRDLLVFLAWSLDARAADEGRSFAAGRLGRRVAAECVTLRTVPGFPGCPGRPFTEEWLPSAPVAWIEKGILKTLAASRWWAARKGTVPVGSPVNLVMDGGAATLRDLVGGMRRGLLVTRFWYIRFVDPMTLFLTGMTRDGLFWVEDGRIAHAVKNLRFNESVLAALSRVEALGRPRVTAGTEGDGAASVPDARLGAFDFASATEF